MAKRKRKNRDGQKFVILELLLILSIIGCIYGTFYFYSKGKTNKNSNSSSYKEYEKLEDSYSDKQEELKKLDSNISDYSNIDEKIESVKKEYFDSIKKAEDDILAGKSERKIVYLTFDDGPYFNTYNIINILDENDVKATFFTISMNGEYCYDNKGARCFDLYKEYVKRGHTIANHTYTHAIRGGLYRSVDSFMDAIDRQEEHIKNQADGYTANIVRFPGGSSQAKNLKEPIIEKLREKGYGWVDWTANDGDGGGLASREQAWNTFTSTINDKIEVVLFHDYNRYTTEILPDAIKYLKDNGYEIYPLFYESNMINK